MPVTANFGWTTPTPGGSSGAWGTILNAAFDAIDATVKPAVAAGTENLETRRISVMEGWMGGTDPQRTQWTLGIPAASFVGDASHTFCSFAVPLKDLRVGQRITAFSSFGNATAGITSTVKLCYADASGNETVVSSGHSLPASLGSTTTGSLSHDVLADKQYYIRVDCSSIGVGAGVNLCSFTVTRTRP